ncbi:MAG: NAD-dependent epimerase/dehydratase family protein [Lachnospiraceae bacterium]|nr:NAD-dependent epimerase/dehydratase family protein [Lachnospiraceae bacterium]
MKALFIGGTGTISMGIIKALAEDPMWEVYLLNRGNRKDEVPANIKQIVANIYDEADAAKKLEGMEFDVVSEFIAFDVEAVKRDYRLFKGKTKQYIFISSASAYNKPAAHHVITEGTTLANPYWDYSRNKIACEEFLLDKYRTEGFPVTIVRPSHTYDERSIPLGVHGNKGFYQVIRRMQQGKPVIIQGDGTSLWALTFNKDFAVGYIALMGNRHAIGEAFQITGDEILSWNQIHQTIADALGVELKPYYVSSEFLADAGEACGYDFRGSLIGDKSVSVVFDNSKLKRLAPTMTTTIPFHKGVRIALDYVLSHKDRYEEDPEFDRFCDVVIEECEKAKAEVIAKMNK